MPGFKRGQLINESKPYAYILNSSERKRRCSYCFEIKENLKRCSQCKFSYYCGKECQVKAWEYHSDECKCIKKIHPHEPTSTILLLAQILHKIKKHGYSKPTELVVNEKRALKDLESHVNEIKSSPKRMEKVRFLEEGLQYFMCPDDVPELDELTEVYGKMVVNTFSILNSENQSIGAGFYIGASIFDHSCEPNAEVVFEKTTVYIRAVQDIPDYDPRKVYISYIDSAQLTEERQKHLEEQYFFRCQCIRCTSPEIEQLMMNSLASPSEVQAAMKKSKANLEIINDIKKKGRNLNQIYDIAMDDLASQDQVLGNTHIYRIKMLEHVLDTCITQGRWSEALAVGYELVEPYRIYYSEHYPDYCILLTKIGKIELLLHHNDKALKQLIKAEKATRISHGTKHPLYLEVQKLLYQCHEEMTPDSVL